MKRFIKLFALPLFLCVLGISSSPAEAATNGDYQYELLTDKTIEITDYTGKTSELTIPTEIAGMKVTSKRYLLTDVVIPEGITNISSLAFSGCSSLRYISIPSSVTSIGYEVFKSCEQLIRINVDIRNSSFQSFDGVLYSKDSKRLLYYPLARTDTTYIIPENVINIDGAFAGNNHLVNIVLSKNIKTIGPNTFGFCSELVNIEIPEGVTTIAEGAFNNCYKLLTVYIPSTVTSIATDAFQNCYNLVGLQVAYNNSNYFSDSFIK